MCIPHAVPDPNGDFVAPARVFQPKPSRSTSSASSHRRYTTSERSPRPSTALTVPPPPAKQQPALVERRSPRKKGRAVPPPLIVQEVGPPKPAHRDSGFILPPADPPVADVSPISSSSPDYPPSLKHRTSIRRPKTSPSHANRAGVPPEAPDAPPAVREQHYHHHHHYYNPPPSSYHHRDASHSSDSTRGRSSTRYSSASRSPHTPHFPARTNSTSGRSDRYSTAASEPEPQLHHEQAKHSETLSPELPRRSASTRSTRYLEPARRRDPIVIQNRDGTRVKQYYYA